MANEGRNFGSSSWCEDEVDANHQNLHHKIIDIANSSISLSTVLNKYNIKLEPSFSSSGWDMRCSCPFPDHNDKRPSFGCNLSLGNFNCFGCHRGGKAVEFIAYMEDRPKLEVAREILKNYSHSSDEVVVHNLDFDFERLQKLLFEFADNIRIFKQKYNYDQQACNYAKSVTWALDVYIQKHSSYNSIVLDDLEIRIFKLNEQLEAYGD